RRPGVRRGAQGLQPALVFRRGQALLELLEVDQVFLEFTRDRVRVATRWGPLIVMWGKLGGDAACSFRCHASFTRSRHSCGNLLIGSVPRAHTNDSAARR